MIAQTLEVSKEVVSAFRLMAGIQELEKESQQQFDAIASSAISERFPGGILALPQAQNTTKYYAIAKTASEWRKLRPFLMAFVGPTFSSFKGIASQIDPKNSCERYLFSHEWYLTTEIHAGQAGHLPQATDQAMRRMISNVLDAPETTQVPPQTTNQLIAQFNDCLIGNDRNMAEQTLEICRAELRLDALNLLFMRVQMHAHFSEWKKIYEMEEFHSLCSTRKPSSVTEVLLEALYQVHFSDLQSQNSLEQQSNLWKNEIRSYAKSMLILPIPKKIGSGGLSLYALEAFLTKDSQPEFASAVKKQSERFGSVSLILESLKELEEIPSDKNLNIESEVEKNLELAQEALLKFDEERSYGSLVEAAKLLENLKNEELVQLESTKPFRLSKQVLEKETHGEHPPKDWLEWVNRLNEPDFTIYFSSLEHAISEWPISELQDPQNIKELKDAFESIPETETTVERLSESLPLLTTWVADDPQFPRPALISIYEVLLFHLIVGLRRESKVLESSALLIYSMLKLGLSKLQYRNLLNDCIDLMGDGIGMNQTYWILDLLEETLLCPCPDQDQRKHFWNVCLSKMKEIEHFLTLGQILVINKLKSTLNWSNSESFQTESKEIENNKSFQVLSGKTLSIYSLTESATKQAANALSELVPDLKISLSTDKVGSPSLKSLARNSDIFVIATSSAKHAATSFIQNNRPKDKTTLFSSGRGFSSIIKVIEDFIQ